MPTKSPKQIVEEAVVKTRELVDGLDELHARRKQIVYDTIHQAEQEKIVEQRGMIDHYLDAKEG